MTAEAKVSILMADNTRQEIEISLETYKAAEDAGMSLATYLNIKYPTNAEQDGTAFAQAMQSCGLYLSDDREYGIRPPTLGAIFNGTAILAGNAIVRPDGSNSRTPAGRLLFPAVLLELLESALRDNKEGYLSAMLQMVAFTRSITSPKYEQVIINYDNPKAARGQPIAQLSRPNRMLTITTSGVTRSIPTYSMGMEISKEALNASTLDLIGLAVREHAIEERSAQVDSDIVACFNGDVDAGMSALPSITALSLDSAIVANGTITQRAWVKYLRRSWRKRQITDVICDIDSFLAVEGRSGRPTNQGDRGTDERLNTVPQIRLPGIPGSVSMFVTETSLLGANTLGGLDRSKALRRIVYAGADYSATEEFVMRKSQAMRMDWAERIERAGYDDAFDKMTLTGI